MKQHNHALLYETKTYKSQKDCDLKGETCQNGKVKGALTIHVCFCGLSGFAAVKEVYCSYFVVTYLRDLRSCTWFTPGNKRSKDLRLTLNHFALAKRLLVPLLFC